LKAGESFIASMGRIGPARRHFGVQEIVIGMAHRGRPQRAGHTLGKMPADLFAEFDHTAKEDLPSGDVKYHQGFSSDITTQGGPVHLSLASTRVTWKIVNPVVEGSVKARMDRRGDKTGAQVLPVLVHGDAAFAGQGVVMETLAPGPDPRLLHRRHGAPGGQQPDRLHDRATPATRVRRCTAPDVVKMIEAPGAARQRRRPGSGGLVHAAGDGLPAGVQEGRGRRHHLLPQARPQRAGHARA
jgi:2-oxoglutarate dehydrogenase E1 component